MSARHVRILTALAVTAALGPFATAQNLYMESKRATSLITDLRARAVGDILTVTINENTQVTNEDRVERDQSTSLAARLEDFSLSDKTFDLNNLPRLDVRKDSSFDGNARQEKDSQIRSSIAVIVIDVQPNGNLVVAGSRTVVVDDETKTFRLSGIVRPLDITRSNTVNSTMVADARISITGSGGNTRQVTRGPVGALFDTLIWAAWPF